MAVQNDAVVKFTTRVQAASRSRSKEVVLTLEEANGLLQGLTLLLNENNDLMRQIIDLKSKPMLSEETIKIEMSGGSFK